MIDELARGVAWKSGYDNENFPWETRRVSGCM